MSFDLWRFVEQYSTELFSPIIEFDDVKIGK
jgi:hypothetical protein